MSRVIERETHIDHLELDERERAAADAVAETI